MSKYPDKTVLPKDAQWIFVSASDKEHRHLLDIVWCVDSLRSIDVPDSNISIFQDNPDYLVHLNPFGMDKLVHPLTNFPKTNILSGTSKCVFFVFTGHGAIDGVHTTGLRITPVDLLNKMREIKDLERGFLILGQCFGGIFEALNASETPEIGIIASTKLHLSYSNSYPIQTNGVSLKDNTGAALPPWAANIFLFYFFMWLRSPIDIDGDKKITLLDAYKYAGSRTNQDLTEIRLRQNLDALGIVEKERQKIRDHFSKKTVISDVEIETSFNVFKNNSILMHLHTEPWILHAHLIRSTLVS